MAQSNDESGIKGVQYIHSVKTTQNRPSPVNIQQHSQGEHKHQELKIF